MGVDAAQRVRFTKVMTSLTTAEQGDRIEWRGTF